jgi:hypothetical protein
MMVSDDPASDFDSSCYHLLLALPPFSIELFEVVRVNPRVQHIFILR